MSTHRKARGIAAQDVRIRQRAKATVSWLPNLVRLRGPMTITRFWCWLFWPSLFLSLFTLAVAVTDPDSHGHTVARALVTWSAALGAGLLAYALQARFAYLSRLSRRVTALFHELRQLDSDMHAFRGTGRARDSIEKANEFMGRLNHILDCASRWGIELPGGVQVAERAFSRGVFSEGDDPLRAIERSRIIVALSQLAYAQLHSEVLE